VIEKPFTACPSWSTGATYSTLVLVGTSVVVVELVVLTVVVDPAVVVVVVLLVPVALELEELQAGMATRPSDTNAAINNLCFVAPVGNVTCRMRALPVACLGSGSSRLT
jgi:hypothetical protein